MTYIFYYNHPIEGKWYLIEVLIDFLREIMMLSILHILIGHLYIFRGIYSCLWPIFKMSCFSITEL